MYVIPNIKGIPNIGMPLKRNVFLSYIKPRNPV
jgi:hypothetical protein